MYVSSERRPKTNPPRTIMAKRNRLRLHNWNNARVIDLGEMEIWDGTDLALLRETLTKVIDREHQRSVGINLAYVKYIPSGFFGMLYDWLERGVRILVFHPQPHVQRMLWFTQFFEPIADGCFLLLDDPKQPYQMGKTPAWATTRPESPDDHQDSAAAAFHAAFDSDDDEGDLVLAQVVDDEHGDE
jgi:hypothetical protein